MTANKLPDINSPQFLEEFYPDYYSSDEIAYYLDLSTYLDGEITKKGFCKKIGYEENRPKARLQRELERIESELRREALENFYNLSKAGEIECEAADDGHFKITSVHRDDLRTANFSEKMIALLDDADMETIARKMADAYCDNSFWIDLPIIVECVLDQKLK